MSSLSFEVTGVRAEPYAAVPTLMLGLRVTETTGTPVHAAVLRCQIMIEPQRRRYNAAEEARLFEMFGETPRWGDTLRPFLWTHVSTTLAGFSSVTDIELPVTCTYDFEIAGSKYLHSLDGGEVPLLLLFSGTVFSKGPAGVIFEPVAWHEEARVGLPVSVWRELMDQYFPNSGWVRVSRTTLDALQRFKSSRALPTWDDTVERLLKEVGEDG